MTTFLGVFAIVFGFVVILVTLGGAVCMWKSKHYWPTSLKLALSFGGIILLSLIISLGVDAVVAASSSVCYVN